MPDGLVGLAAVWAQTGNRRWLSFDVVLGRRLLEVQHVQAGEVQDIDGMAATSGQSRY